MINVNIRSSVYNNVYRPYIDEEASFFLCYGGAGSGKSFFIAQRTIERILRGGRNYLVIRKVGATLRDSVFALLNKVINEWGLNQLFKVNKTDFTITCANGYKIICKGLDDPEKIKSITVEKGLITDVWIEEATELTDIDLKQLTLRLRGGQNLRKQVVMTFNPISQLHWLKKRFFDVIDDSVKILKTTYLDNEYLTGDDIARIEYYKDVDYEYYRIYGLGEWGTIGNRIFTNWSVADLNEISPSVKKRYGLDWGFNPDPFTLVETGRKGNIIYIFREEYRQGLINKELIPITKDFIGNHLVMADCAENKSIEEFKRANIKIYGVKKGAGSVVDGIRFLKDYKIIIDSKCVQTINEFQSYKNRELKDGTILPEPADKFNHCIDALRYAWNDEITGCGVRISRIKASSLGL